MTTKTNTLTWNSTKEEIVAFMSYILETTDQTNVSALVYCDNPGVIIYDPIESIIRGERKVAEATHPNGRTIKLIIGKED